MASIAQSKLDSMYETPPRYTPFDSRDRTLHSAGSDPDPIRPRIAKEAEHAAEEVAAPTSDPQTMSLPPSFVERGEVLCAEEMTTRYTDAEWEEIFREVEAEVEAWLAKEGKGQGGGKKKRVVDLGEVAGRIDHTLLKLDAKGMQIDELCSEARRHGFASVCVRPAWVQQCTSNLQNTRNPHIKTAAVIAFHEGTQDLSSSILEIRSALEAGADEFDIVLNHALLTSSPSSSPNDKFAQIYNHLASLRQQAPEPKILKLILETSQLTRSQIVAAATLAAAASYDFIKTSTGFNGAGATVENVRLMSACCEVLAKRNGGGKKMHVKASGGIRTLGDAVEMLEAGAERLGSSGGVGIAKEAREKGKGEGGDGGESIVGGATRLETDY
ncbi:hypothetical protein DOTSEDRAFT_75463 [Lecanosticta acicola]|uniref:deoxyribose-phosphate aldolase n=1 Tax=Lecanosticta acicola TaxID=111012 RepID=A0AAI8YPJ4_9PEZI|nr:hypothetical protein DOTSEDRAFT_75463 [Lecanosticta acicola]